MKHFLLTAAIVAMCLQALPAQHLLSNESLVSSGFFPERSLQNRGPQNFEGTLLETLDYVFDSISEISPIKGFNAALLLPDGSYWKRASGLSAQLPVPQGITTDHLMGMGSISKSFVAATLLLLYEDGLLALDDSIGQYVGPYPNVPGAVTIRQLLSHRSGINDYINENIATVEAWAAAPDSIWNADTLLNHYVLEPNFPVGTEWSYSNTNYLLASRIIENITGQPWYEVVRARVLDPLGLTHTFSYPWETPDAQPFSHVWADLDGNGTVEDFQGVGLPVEGLFSIAGSGGCLVSTPEDLVRFSERLYGGHLLQPATLAEMQTDYLQSPGSGAKYGLGTASFPFPFDLENWGHDGDLLYKSLAFYFPTEQISLAVQQNDDRSHDPADQNPVLDFVDMYLALLDAYVNYVPVSGVSQPGSAPWNVFPNPVSDRILVRRSGLADVQSPFRCTLTNAYGQPVFSQIMANEDFEIPVAHLPAGVYQMEWGGVLKKIVKQ